MFCGLYISTTFNSKPPHGKISVHSSDQMRVVFSTIAARSFLLTTVFSLVTAHAQVNMQGEESCHVREVEPGYYFRQLDPIAMLEMSVASRNQLSMALFFSLDERVIFQSEEMGYTFDPKTCQMVFSTGKGWFRKFGGDRGTFVSPREMVEILRGFLPDGDLPVDLTGGLTATFKEDSIIVLGVFGLARAKGPQAWLSLVENHSKEEEWSLTIEEKEELAKLPSLMMVPPVTTSPHPGMEIPKQSQQFVQKGFEGVTLMVILCGLVLSFIF